MVASDERRLCVVPRWAANQDMEWYSWLCEQERVRERFPTILRPDVENYEVPTVEAWVMKLFETCGNAMDRLARTYFIGHSVGCQAILRYLATIPSGGEVAGALMVAGWWQLDEPWDTIRPWLQADDPQASDDVEPLDFEHLRAVCSHVQVLISDDDPYTSDVEATEREWRDKLDAEVNIVPGAKHFNGSEMPAVLDALCVFVDS